MIAALLAMAAVWLVAGWWALASGRRSRRAARLWAAAALTVLAGAHALASCDCRGRGGRCWSGRGARPTGLAALLWIAALALVFRAREPGRAWGLALLAVATAAFTFRPGRGVAWPFASHSGQALPRCKPERSVSGPRAARNRADCRKGLHRRRAAIEPALRLAGASEMRPQQRDYCVGEGGRHAGSAIVYAGMANFSWQLNAGQANPECAAVKLEWRASRIGCAMVPG